MGLQSVLFMVAKQAVLHLRKEGNGELLCSHVIFQVTVMRMQLKSRGKPRSELNMCSPLGLLPACVPKARRHRECPITAFSSSMLVSSPVGRSMQNLGQAALGAHPSPCVARKEHKQEARSHRKFDYRSFAVHRSIIFNTSIAVPRVRKEHLISPPAQNLRW